MGGFIGSAIAGAIFKTTTAKIIGGLVIGAVATKAISWLQPKPETPQFDIPQGETAQGVLLNKASNNAQIPVVYGERKLGITRVFVESSGTNNQYLYVAGVLCEGEIESIEEIYIDDKLVTFDGALTDGTVREVDSSDSNYYKDGSSHIQVQSFLGTDTQVASSILTTSSNWTSNHRLKGVAYLAFRFKWNQDIFGSLPDVKVIVKGRKVYDPRTDTTAYSDNSALCLLDYLRNTRYGKGIPDSAFESDFASFKTSANTCETQVTPYSGASDIDLFRTNAVLDTSQQIIENVRSLLNPMRAIFTYNSGTYKLNIEGTGTATYTITSDNVIGGIKLIGETKNKKYNRVIGTFVNPEKNWQEDTVSFPPADDSALPTADKYATLLAEDNGTQLLGNFDFKNITNPYQAEELCEVVLKRSRNALAIQIQVTSEFIDLTVGDIVNVTYDTASFSAKPFRVNSLTINDDLTVNLDLVEYQDNIYTWTEKSEAPTIPDTTLPNPFNVQPPASVTLSDQLIQYNDGTVLVAMDIAIGASPDSFVDYYQVEYKKNTETDYQIHAQGTGLNQRVLNVIDQDTYDVRVKAINTLGVSSTYVTVSRTIVGAVAPPDNVTDFSCNILGQEAHLNWEAVKNLDLAYYQIRYSTLTTGAEWQNSVSLIEKVSRPATSISVPARVGSYLIKAVDKLGNFSINETIVSTNVLAIGNFNSVATQTESPNFTGAKTNITLENNTLKLTSLDSDGIYDFSAPIDIGAVHTSRVTASITQFAEDPTDLFDSGRGFTLFDDATGSFDGDSVSNSNAHLEIALSDDNITYTEFRNFVIGDYTARYYKFRLYLISRDQATTPVISALSVSIDMEDRIQSENDIVSGAGTKTVTFTNPFKTANYAVGITGENMATGDYFVVTNKTISNFQVTFYDSSDTAISRTFDMIAKGF
jgi:hypothetical protein